MQLSIHVADDAWLASPLSTVNISECWIAWELLVLPDSSHVVLQNGSNSLRTPLNRKVTCNCYNLHSANRQLCRKQTNVNWRTRGFGMLLVAHVP
jgi:hypothetical protein